MQALSQQQKKTIEKKTVRETKQTAWGRNERSVIVLENIELPGWIRMKNDINGSEESNLRQI